MINKIAVVGSRGVDPDKVEAWLALRSNIHLSDEIVSGGAVGADTGARLHADKWGMVLKEFLPDWDKHGKAAGFIRNKYIADYADACIAFWDGSSKGTRDTINKFLDLGKPIQVLVWKNEEL